MDVLSRLFVQQPLQHPPDGAGAVVLRGGGRMPAIRHPDAVFLPAMAWLAYAAWEWLVLMNTPEVSIRVDLLMIWPRLMLTTIWAAASAFRP